jgi:hypothetical protein
MPVDARQLGGGLPCPLRQTENAEEEKGCEVADSHAAIIAQLRAVIYEGAGRVNGKTAGCRLFLG